MCVYSVVADDWSRRAHQTYPWIGQNVTFQPPITRTEFDQLREEVRALRDLLHAAKIYDERTGQPDCEVEEKIAFIRQAAELVGLDLSDVLPGEK
jgi:hypothetical protein